MLHRLGKTNVDTRKEQELQQQNSKPQKVVTTTFYRLLKNPLKFPA
jgi:hypothetical protein